MVVWYSVGMDSENIIKWLQEAILAVQSDDPVTALGAISHAQVLLEDAAGDAFIPDDEHDQFASDAEADADALASAGWGTDEDYDPSVWDSGLIGGDSDLMGEY